MAQFIIGIIMVVIGLVGAYVTKDGWEKMNREDKPKFVVNFANVRFMESSETKGSLMFIEIEVVNLGSPSVVTGWQAELKLGSQITSRVLPTSIPDGFKILGDGGKLIAEFREDNRLETKAIEKPLIRGARVSGWLRFDFIGITKEQLTNAEKTICVRDILGHEYSFKFKDLSSITNTHLPGSGTPPFMP
jgi:hypothetical protein